MKHLLTLVVTMAAVSSFAAFNWNSQTKAEIETGCAELIERAQTRNSKAEQKQRNINDANLNKAVLIALIGKDAKNTTLNDLRTIIQSEVEKTEKTPSKVKYITDFKTVQIIYCVSRFRTLAENVLKDASLKNNKYVKCHYPVMFFNYYSTKDALAACYELAASKDKMLSNNFKNVWRKYKEIINSLPAKDAIKELQQIKRHAYQRIEKDEDWKKIVVEVELMLKGLQQ